MGGERRLIQILKTLFYYKSLFMKMLALKFQAEVDKYRLRGYFFPDSTNFGFAVIFRDFSFSQKIDLLRKRLKVGNTLKQTVDKEDTS